MEKEIIKFMSRYLDLTDEEKNIILELDLATSYKKGTILLKEGEYSDKGYFVMKGIVRYYYMEEDVEKTTDFFTEGDVFEPPCVSEKSPSKLYVSCIEDCILSGSTYELGNDIMEQFPRFEKICRLVAENSFKKNQQALYNFKLLTPEKRYEQLSKDRPDLIQRIPQYLIASYLGIKPESLSRIRKRMLKN